MTRSFTTLSLAAAALALGTTTTHAATLVSSSFNENPSASVDTTGAADWGYFIASNSGFTAGMATGNAVNFDALTQNNGAAATVSKASPSTGEVFYTPTDTSAATSNTIRGFSFDGNAAGNVIGDIAATEEIFSMKFNDLGVGIHTVTFYTAHGHVAPNPVNTSRKLDIDYFVYEDDDAETSATLSATGLVSETFEDFRVTYSLTFSTTTDNTDLVLNLGSAGSDAGAWTMSGYTVFTVPEPGSLALLGLGGLCVFRRRRRD